MNKYALVRYCLIMFLMINSNYLFSQSPCTAANYAAAPVVPANAYPYFSPSTGITVTATLGGGIGTLNNFQYACDGIAYNGANPVWWLNNAAQSITLTFSQPVCSFSVIVNGTGNTEEFYFSQVGPGPNNCLGVSGLCTIGWTVINGGTGMLYNGGGASSNLLVVQNSSGSTTYLLTHNGLAAGSRYALVDCFQPCPLSPICTVLPVEILSFDGESYNGYNELTWTTESELNNDYFVVEYSNTGTEPFIELGRVDGAGNSNTLLNYSFTDKNKPLSDLTYYRLKQIDFDGKFTYSDIIALESKSNQDGFIYPNPSTGNLFFDLKESRGDDIYTITYTNVLGNFHKEVINITKGINTYKVNDFSKLNSGIYFIQIMDKNNEVIKNQKIVKE